MVYPSFEVKLCGHATIAAAHLLHIEHNVKGPIFFHTLNGVLKVDFEDDKVTLNFPSFEYERINDERILEPFGILDYNEIRFWLESPVPSFCIILREQEQLKKLRPDFSQLIEISKDFGILGIIITAPGEYPYDYVFRQFAPRAGIYESQGAGAVHCVLAPYWGKKLGKNKMRAYQFSERGSEMEIELNNNIVRISGSAICLIKGKMSVPFLVEKENLSS